MDEYVIFVLEGVLKEEEERAFSDEEVKAEGLGLSGLEIER